MESAYQVFKHFLENQAEESRPTALIALNDLAAIGTIRAAADLGISVPDDLSVLGVDDIPLGRFLMKRLTTIRQPVEAMAEATATMLLNRLNKPKATGENPSVQTMNFVSQLVIRETTGTAKA